MIMDWKDALGSLLQEGNLPEGEPDAPETEAVPADSKTVQKTPVHVLIEKKGRAGKTATIVEGFDCPDETLQEVARQLKRRLGVGGSARGGEILIQGNLLAKVKEALTDMGYKVKG